MLLLLAMFFSFTFFFCSFHRVHFVSAHFLKTFQLSRAFDMFRLVRMRVCVCVICMNFFCSFVHFVSDFFRDQK